MKNIILIKTKNDNYYIYSLIKKQIFCITKNVYILLKKAEKGTNLDNLKFSDFCSGQNKNIDEENFKKAKIKAAFYLKFLLNQNDVISLINKFSVDDIKYYLSGNPNICFEITENCNLECKYCAYSDYYYGFDKRTKQNLSLIDAKEVIDYVYKFCNTKENISHKKNINIGFYGGEPLLRFSTIQKIIDYTKKLKNEVINFTYSMTTNGVLLHKFMDELVDNRFDLLVSLDGNKQHNAHRVYRNGSESFSQVFKNVFQLKKLHPEFFDEHVEFNSVVHNLTNKKEITTFFKDKFNKKPDFSDLSYDNIKSEKRKNFIQFFNTTPQASLKDTNAKKANNEFDSSETNEAYFISKLTKYLTNNYSTLYNNQDPLGKYTGTCIPFSRKFFVTAKGKILPCENIDHKFSFGNINNGKINMDLTKLADYYNKIISETTRKCKDCYRIYDCEECAFRLNIEHTKKYYNCYTNKKRFEKYLIENISDLEINTEKFQKFLKDGILL